MNHWYECQCLGKAMMLANINTIQKAGISVILID